MKFIVKIVLLSLLAFSNQAILFVQAKEGCKDLSVLSFNIWGIPGNVRWIGSKYLVERALAIGNRIKKAEYDIYLLQEVWMRSDHAQLMKGLPQGYSMTTFEETNPFYCDGVLTPLFCSGLAIISKYPMPKVKYSPFTVRGNPDTVQFDGEWIARRGIVQAGVSLDSGLRLEVFTTHTASSPGAPFPDNSNYREEQIKELMTNFVDVSEADVVVMGGDLNFVPMEKGGNTYGIINGSMTNCLEEFTASPAWKTNPTFATWANPRNTFSQEQKTPQLLDYIFYKDNSDAYNLKTTAFEMPFYTKTLKKNDSSPSADITISLSDHQAIGTNIEICPS